MTQQNPDDSSLYDVTARDSFGSLAQALMTLLQALTLDSIAGIYRPLITERPELSIYFVCFILLAAIAMMNLVTGIMVDGAITMVVQDRDTRKEWELARKKELAKILSAMFTDLDADQSGEVTLNEIRAAQDEVLEVLQ